MARVFHAMAAAALCVTLAAPAAAQLAPDDFARGADIRSVEGASILRITLPRDVYDTVTRPDLADLRVFNAAGEPVPHTLRQPPPPSAGETDFVDVPSFPFYSRASDGGATTHVRVGRDGAVLEVTNDRSAGQVLTAYLVDVSAVDDPVAALSLDWQAPPDASFLARVRVEASDDLDRWRTVVPSAALARLQQGANVLTQSAIDLPSVRARYLRLAWPPELMGVTLTGVRVRPQEQAPRVERTWAALVGQRDDAAAVYDAGGHLPIDRIDLELADSTDTVLVTVHSRPDESATWITRHSGLFYSLGEDGDRLRSAPQPIARTSDRWWRLEANREGGWRPDRLPQLRVGWVPHELLFVAQGGGPYTLAYGSARAGGADAPLAAVLASLDPADRENRVRDATLEAPRDLGGAAALTRPQEYRQFVLWGVLIGAVAVLAWFAGRVLRDVD